METYVHELQSATEFVRQLFADQQVDLDYSPQSIHYLDALFDKEFYKGELKNKGGTFAQYQGLIMTGVSGYIAQVILQNTDHAQLGFEENDENWFVNFSLESENGQKIIPGHRVLKRAYNGEEDQLYAYVIEAIRYFREPETGDKPGLALSQVWEDKKVMNRKRKQWWKVW